MAYLEIGGTPCPKCGSTATMETQHFLVPREPRREVFLKCASCGHEESYGVYTIVGNSLVKD